jgi:hypothetical protein
MTAAWLVGMALVGVNPPEANTQTVDLKAYEDAKSKAQRDPDAHVRLALWCEAHQLDALRLKHLAIAVLTNPEHATARGLMGLVAYGGKWQKPEAVAETVRADAKLTAALSEYNDKRAKTPPKPDDQWQLALWCEQKGLKAEATAHLATVVRLDPAREAAWKHLGYRKHNGRWMTDAQVAAEKADALAQARADRHWLPLLEKWRTWLAAKDKKAEAEKQLAAISDPRAVPAIVRAFSTGGAGLQLKAVQLLGQIDAPTASRALATVAVFGASAEVRQASIEKLRTRDASDFMALWVGMIRKPFKLEVQHVGGPGSPGVLFVEGEQFNVRRLYDAPPLPAVAVAAYYQWASEGFISLDPIRERRLARVFAEFQTSALSSQQKLQSDLATVELANKSIELASDAALLALKKVTEEDVGEDREDWAKWASEKRGYVYKPPPSRPKPTFAQFVDAPYAPFSRSGQSCFGKGTLVRTLKDWAPIETLRVGDVALVRDTGSGALSFQPIVAVYHNSPASTLKLRVGNETVVATPIHRFWKAGKGWVMARELKPGDRIRSINQVLTVETVESDQIQPVFNLEVAEGQCFFVGRQGLLVHDNSLVRPELHPFDAEPSLTVASSEKGN